MVNGQSGKMVYGEAGGRIARSRRRTAAIKPSRPSSPSVLAPGVAKVESSRHGCRQRRHRREAGPTGSSRATGSGHPCMSDQTTTAFHRSERSGSPSLVLVFAALLVAAAVAFSVLPRDQAGTLIIGCLGPARRHRHLRAFRLRDRHHPVRRQGGEERCDPHRLRQRPGRHAGHRRGAASSSTPTTPTSQVLAGAGRPPTCAALSACSPARRKSPRRCIASPRRRVTASG